MHRKDSEAAETPRAHDEDSAGSRDDIGRGVPLSLPPSSPHTSRLCPETVPGGSRAQSQCWETLPFHPHLLASSSP